MKKVIVTPDNISEIIDDLKAIIEKSTYVGFGDFFSPINPERIEEIAKSYLDRKIKIIEKYKVGVSSVADIFEESTPLILIFHSECTIRYECIIAKFGYSIMMDEDKIIVISADQKWGYFISLLHSN